MIPLSRVNWGPTDATAKDRQFSDKWVEPIEIRSCLETTKWIVSGEKGVGKSALRKALVELHGKDYFCARVVDFNNISFRALEENLVALAKTTSLSKTAMLSHCWQYAMIVELLVAAANKNSNRYGHFLAQLPDQRTSVSLNERLLQLLEDVWNAIDDYTGVQSVRNSSSSASKANLISSSGLTAKLLHEISRYPLDPKFERLRQDFFSTLDTHGDRIVLVLDGFDRLNNAETPPEATQLIFASLVDAIQAIYVDQDRPDNFELKAFIPHDRYLSLQLRDSDKTDTMHVAIRWSPASLQLFIQKRIELTSKIQSSASFGSAWRQVMPDVVTNSRYGLEEDSFEYLLRHSMMRPRQMQVHLETLSGSYRNQVIDPSMVPVSVVESSKKIAQYFGDEFQVDYPFLKGFIASFQKQDNVLEYKAFRSLVEFRLKRFAGERATTVDSMIDTLYAMSFFGVVNFLEQGRDARNLYCPPTRESRRHWVDFFYKNPHMSISATLSPESVVAFHPVFIDSCSLRSHDSLIVG